MRLHVTESIPDTCIVWNTYRLLIQMSCRKQEVMQAALFPFPGGQCLSRPEHLSPINVPARIFHLGYLLLLDELDKKDSEYGIKAARVLHELQKKGTKPL